KGTCTCGRSPTSTGTWAARRSATRPNTRATWWRSGRLGNAPSPGAPVVMLQQCGPGAGDVPGTGASLRHRPVQLRHDIGHRDPADAHLPLVLGDQGRHDGERRRVDVVK